MHIEQVDHVKQLGVFFTSTLSINSHINNEIAIINQQLYLFNQLHKQGLDIHGLTQIFMGLVVARFQYALAAIAGEIFV